MDDEEINAEALMELYKSPHNYGKMENPSSKMLEYNPVCGDTVQIMIAVENGTIKNASFIGRGCSISQASASIVTDMAREMKLDDAEAIDENQYIKLLGVNLGPSREKCALLALNALKKCIQNYKKEGKNR